MTVRASTVLKVAFYALLCLAAWVVATACFPAEDILIPDDGAGKIDTVYVPSPLDTVIMICDKPMKHCHRWEPYWPYAPIPGTT